MKNIALNFIFLLVSFLQEDFYSGRWKVEDMYSTKETQELKDIAINHLVKNKLSEEEVFVLITKDSIKMEQNKIIIEAHPIKALRIFKEKDSVEFNFDNSKANFSISKDRNQASLLINNKTYMVLKKE